MRLFKQPSLELYPFTRVQNGNESKGEEWARNGCLEEIDVLRPALGDFLFFFFLNKFIYLFIYFWLCWVLVAAAGIFVEACGIFSLQCTVCLGFCLVAVHWLLSSCGTQVFSL